MCICRRRVANNTSTCDDTSYHIMLGQIHIITSSFSLKTRAIISGWAEASLVPHSSTAYLISSHFGLQVKVMTRLGYPYSLQTTNESWKFCSMYLYPPVKLDGNITRLPTSAAATSPHRTLSTILLYKYDLMIDWWSRTHGNRLRSTAHQASTTNCKNNLPQAKECGLRHAHADIGIWMRSILLS